MAEGGEEALARCRERRFDVFICDIAMPGRDGYALLQEIRARDVHGRFTPAIAVSAFADREAATRARDAGYQRFVAKPVRVRASGHRRQRGVAVDRIGSRSALSRYGRARLAPLPTFSAVSDLPAFPPSRLPAFIPARASLSLEYPVRIDRLSFHQRRALIELEDREVQVGRAGRRLPVVPT